MGEPKDKMRYKTHEMTVDGITFDVFEVSNPSTPANGYEIVPADYTWLESDYIYVVDMIRPPVECSKCHAMTDEYAYRKSDKAVFCPECDPEKEGGL